MKAIELEYVGPGKWVTTDKAFGVVKKFRPINPMESSSLPGKMDKHIFSVRDLREFTMPGLYYELAPEVYQARRFKDIVPWIGGFISEQKLSESSEYKNIDKNWARNVQRWFDNWVNKWKKIPVNGASRYIDQTIVEAVNMAQKLNDYLRTEKGYWGHEDYTIDYDPRDRTRQLLYELEKGLMNTLRSYATMVGRRISNGELVVSKARSMMHRKAKEVVRPLAGILVTMKQPSKDEPTDFGRVEQKFSIGKVTFLIELPSRFNVRKNKGNAFDVKKSVEELVLAAKKSQAMLNNAGLGAVWYGKIHAGPHGSGARQPSAHMSTAAYYRRKGDMVVIWLSASQGWIQVDSKGLAENIVHELGHRYWYKFMNREKQAQFSKWFGKVKSVSEYGGKNVVEDFAETFAWYVLKKGMSSEQRSRFRQIALSGGKGFKAKLESIQDMRRSILGEHDRFNGFLLTEKKDHLINRLVNLSNTEKKEVLALFLKKPNLEGKINWNNKNLKFSDFKNVMKVTKTERKKRVKNLGIIGLEKGFDYLELKGAPDGYIAVIPLNWEISKHLANSKIGGVTGKWCIATQRSSTDWTEYVHESNLTPIYFITQGQKYAAMVKGSVTKSIWDKLDIEIRLENLIKDVGFGNVPAYRNFIRDNSGQISKARAIFSKVKSSHWFESELESGAIKVKNADYDIINHKLIWKGGIWLSGVWKDGVWKGGTWKGGVWENGKWEGGTWHGGEWMSGHWNKGTWKGGVWISGTWQNGTWENGEWESGTWLNGVWKDGEWGDGTWREGTWHDGGWETGTWEGGTWKNGDWEDGDWKGGTWLNGIWKDGYWMDGKWEGGTWYDGIWTKGTWNDGSWKAGSWFKGTWNGGVDKRLEKHKAGDSPNKWK